MKCDKNLEALCNSLNQYFSEDQYMVFYNYAWVKDLFKMQGRPMDFNVIEYKSSFHKISYFILQVIFKK